jgi:hypothetical protein
VDGSARGEDFYMATRGEFLLAIREDLEVATREDFFMATDKALLEVVQVPEDAFVTYVEPWILERAGEVVDEAREYGDAALSTSMGTVDVTMRRAEEANTSRLEVDWHSILGFGGDREGKTFLGVDDSPDVRSQMAAFVARWVVALVGEWDPY